MSEGAWESVTSHVSRDRAATIRQAGLYSLTADRANPHFTHNIHVYTCVYMYIHAYTCTLQYIHALCIIHVYAYMYIYTLWSICGVGEGKGQFGRIEKGVCTHSMTEYTHTHTHTLYVNEVRQSVVSAYIICLSV